MKQEVGGIADILEVVPRSLVPQNNKPLPAAWEFKRKFLLGWSIRKWKAHLNNHGSHQMQGMNDWDTFAPVVNWSMVSS
jgi:hypothetical protein